MDSLIYLGYANVDVDEVVHHSIVQHSITTPTNQCGDVLHVA